MKILSLFDGISCAQVALKKRRIKIEAYYASEIDRNAISISLDNFPDTKHVGGVLAVNRFNFPHIFDSKIDLLIGGSPCQDLSIAKANRKGLRGDRSGLFWEYVRILKELKPRYFILENVNSMPKEDRQIITQTLGVEPIMIDAALVSAQRRKRLFWTNIPNVTQPDDRGIFLKDILEDFDPELEHVLSSKQAHATRDKIKSPPLVSAMGMGGGHVPMVMKDKANTIRAGGRGSGIGDKHDWDSVYQFRRTYWRETKDGKVPTLTANMGTGGHNVPFIEQTARGFNKGGKKFDKVPTLTKNAWEHNHKLNGIRKLTPVECERLQGLPDGYASSVSNTQRYKACGNAFHVDVIAHIISFIPKND